MTANGLRTNWTERERIIGKDEQYVKINITNDSDEQLHTHYLKKGEYGLPAGRIESGESAREAAARELLERTGYRIDEQDLNEIGKKGDFLLFAADASDAKQIAAPGEAGGYETDVKWL